MKTTSSSSCNGKNKEKPGPQQEFYFHQKGFHLHGSGEDLTQPIFNVPLFKTPYQCTEKAESKQDNAPSCLGSLNSIRDWLFCPQCLNVNELGFFLELLSLL
jgi:hypothetical protein